MKINKLNPQVAERLAKHVTPEGHRRQMSRRDFLAAGLLQGSAAFVMPSLVGLLSSEARAQASSALPPAYIEINCAGGIGMSSNTVMLDANRGLLPSYNLCLQGSRSLAEQNVARLFSNQAPLFKNSGLYKGLTSVLANSPDVLQQSALLAMATSIGADTGTNPMSAFGLVQASTAPARYLPRLQTFSSFNLPAFVSPPNPIVVDSVEALTDNVRPRETDTLAQFQQSTKGTLLKYLRQINTSQAGRLGSRPGAQELKRGADLAAEKLTALNDSGGVDFDPRNDAAFKAIWGSAWDGNSPGLIDPALSLVESVPQVLNRNLNESFVIYSLAKGYGNIGGLYRTGYDYHGAPRAITDALDALIGQLIGRVLLSFKATGRAVYIYVTSDGTCSSPASDAGGNKWVGDGNVNSVNLIVAYRPGIGVQVETAAGRPETQIGSFTSGQICDLTHPVASSRGSATAAFVNYLNFAGIDGVNSQHTKVTTMVPEQLRRLSAIKLS